MSAAQHAKGPLGLLMRSQAAQYLMLGGGAATYLFPEQVGPFFRQLVASLGSEGWEWPHFRTPERQQHQSVSPIIIHTSTNGDRKASFVSTIISCAVGAGFVWISYTLCANFLPEHLKEYFPVTRKVFEHATEKLAAGIVHVKEVLTEQIQYVMQQQSKLQEQQEATHQDVKDTKKNLQNARNDLSLLQKVMDRCDIRLEDTQRLQAYTARGVHLLVRCVASIMPHDEKTLKDLANYHHERQQYPLIKEIDDDDDDDVEVKPGHFGQVHVVSANSFHQQLYDAPEMTTLRSTGATTGLDAVQAMLGRRSLSSV